MTTNASIVGKILRVVVPIGGIAVVFFLAQRYRRAQRVKRQSFWVIVDPELSNKNFWRVVYVQPDHAWPNCDPKNWHQLWAPAYDQKFYAGLTYCKKKCHIFVLTLKSNKIKQEEIMEDPFIPSQPLNPSEIPDSPIVPPGEEGSRRERPDNCKICYFGGMAFSEGAQFCINGWQHWCRNGEWTMDGKYQKC